MTRPYSTPRKPLPPDVLLVECPEVVKSDVEQHARWHRDQHKQLDAS